MPDPFRRGSRETFSALPTPQTSGLIEERQPALWVHGHTHDSCDYRVGNTRVICNPRGYENENGAFDPGQAVRV